MINKIILTFLVSFTGIISFSQQIPVGSCGIINIYDAAGNRTKRVYFCNNGTDLYPQARGVAVPAQQKTAVSKTNEVSANQELEFQEVEALYPNPTTGKFSVSFSKALDNSTIHLLDAGGKIIRQVRATGYKIEFDLSADAGGIYYVRIQQDGNIITKKVVKQ